MQDDDQISQRARQNREADERHADRGAGHRAQAGDQPGGDGLSGALSGGQEDPGLTELPAEMVPEDTGRADGRIIEAGEGGTAGGLDEAEEALASGVPDAREGR